MNKMMKILMVAVAVIVAFALIFLIGKAAGVFGKRSDSQISVSNEIEVPNLVGQPGKCCRDDVRKEAAEAGSRIRESIR